MLCLYLHQKLPPGSQMEKCFCPCDMFTGFMFIQNKYKQVCLYSRQPDGGLKHISVLAQNRLLTPPDYSIGCSAPL